MPDYTPLPGTLNELFSRRQQEQDAEPRSLVPDPTRGFVPSTPVPAAPPQERTPTTREVANTLMGVVGAGMSIPKRVLWNLGPALVGRSGEGPQTGAEALQRLGLDYNSPGQRALGHGAGAALDLLGDPMNLMGMGTAGRGAAAAAPAAAGEGALVRRLERMVTPVAEANAAGRPVMQARLDNWAQGVGRPPSQFAPGAGGPPSIANAGALPRPPGPTVPNGGGQVMRAGPGTRGYVDPSAFGYDEAALRSVQLNSPNFNPNAPALGLGTGQFTQDASHAARMGLADYNPLSTSRLLPSAASAETAAPSLTRQLESLSSSTPSRLDRMLGRTPPAAAQPPAASPLSNLGIPVDSEGTPIVRSLADQLRNQQRQGSSTQPLGGFRGATTPEMPSTPPPRPMSSQPDGPGLFPGQPNLTAHDLGVAPDQLVSPRALTIPPNRQATIPLNQSRAPAPTPSPSGQFDTSFSLGGQARTELEREALRAGHNSVESYLASRPPSQGNLGDLWRQLNPPSALNETPNPLGGTLGFRSPTIPQPPPGVRYPWEY